MESKELYTLKEFVTAHRITKNTYYKLMKTGRGPRSIKLDGKILISKEAARDWVKEREMDNGI